MRRCILIASLFAFLLPAGARAAGKEFELTVKGGKADTPSMLVCVPLSLPKSLAAEPVAGLKWTPSSDLHIGQLTAPGLLTESIEPAKGQVRRDLHFFLPSLKAGQTLTIKGSVLDGMNPQIYFAWHDKPGRYSELTYGERPVLRYIDVPFDDSSKAKREETFKVYHHLYEPSGKAIITKGPGGLYTHHRGLFYGFKATYETADGKKVTADTWHCPPPSGDPKKPSLEAHLEHEKILSSEASVILGRQRVQIGWFGRDKQRFAVEERELTVYDTSKGTLVEFASKLTPLKGTVHLDGDPQHAGFHFRAVNEVDKNKGETYFLRPFGKGEMGKETNYPQDKKMVNLPWNAMSFVVGGKRYTAAYFDRPDNPKEARYSERTYGRFGSYFVADCTAKKPLLVDYRLWLQEGEMTKEDIEARSNQFVKPPSVTVK